MKHILKMEIYSTIGLPRENVQENSKGRNEVIIYNLFLSQKLLD